MRMAQRLAFLRMYALWLPRSFSTCREQTGGSVRANWLWENEGGGDDGSATTRAHPVNSNHLEAHLLAKFRRYPLALSKALITETLE
eukprot:732563-Prorocentrum_minimum.AAC.2